VWIVLGFVVLVGRWIPDVDLWDLVWDHWPLVLVGLGLALAADALAPRRDPRGLREETPRAEVFAFLGTSIRSNASHRFAGGDLVALAGKVELDLTRARISSGEAVLDVVAFWGGIDVRVPPEWRVALEVQSFMGGAVDATRPSSPSDGRLVVRGWTVMGAVQVS
jgi:hypothetical protein